MNDLPYVMHPRYQEYLTFLDGCPHRKSAAALEFGFWVWMNKKSNQSVIVVEQAKRISLLEKALAEVRD